MKQNSKRLLSILLGLTFIVVALLVLFDFIEPTYGDLENAKAQEQSDQAFLVSGQTLINQAKTILATYQSDTTAEQDLALAMPSGPNVAGAIAQIYGIAANNGITIQSLGITPPTIQTPPTLSNNLLTSGQIVKPVGNYSFQIGATGSYESLKSFLLQLQSNVRIFDVTSFSLQAANTASNGKAAVGNQDLFTYSITVATYYQLP
jgi:Tfp pilus assembly protein PilO